MGHSREKRETDKPGSIEIFLNEYVRFNRPFVMKTSLSFEEVCKRLEALDSIPPDAWSGMPVHNAEKLQTYVYQEETRETKFAMIIERFRNTDTGSGYLPSARADGLIYARDGATILEGQVIVSGFSLWLSLLFLPIFIPLFLYPFNPHPGLIVTALFFSAILGYRWNVMYNDRNEIMGLLKHSIQAQEI